MHVFAAPPETCGPSVEQPGPCSVESAARFQSRTIIARPYYHCVPQAHIAPCSQHLGKSVLTQTNHRTRSINPRSKKSPPKLQATPAKRIYTAKTADCHEL